MSFFSKMKLSGKIISMVLVLMVLLLVVSAVSILKMQNIGREINEVSKELIPLTELVTGIEMYQLEQEVVYERALRYANIKEDSGLEDIREEFTKYSRLVGKEVAEAEKIAKYMIVEAGTDAELKEHREVYEQIQHIKAQHAAYEQHVMQVFQAIAQGDKSNTEAVSAGLKAEEEALGNEIKEFLAVVERFTEEAALAAERDEHSALIIIISVAFFSMLFGSLIATAAIRTILKQLGGDPIVITALAERIAAGDVSMGNESGKRYFEGIMRSMIDMSGKLIKIVGQISGYSTFVAASSDELTALSGKIAGGVEEQSQQIEQAATAASEVSQTIADVARNASEATNAANESLAAANEGKSIVEQTVVSMMNISGTVDMSSKQMEALGESSQHIGEIIDVISDIAGQTNLLALNAAIEAARAGDQGRGFAVVADEVKKLAEKTTAATEEITRMVTKIQSDTGESVKSMEKNKLEAETGVNLAERSTEALEKIVESSRTSLDMMNSIATATEQQSSAVEEVSTGMESIASAFADSRDALTHINSSTNELSLIAQDLMAIVSWFKMEPIENEWNGYKQINNSSEENNGHAVAATLQ